MGKTLTTYDLERMEQEIAVIESDLRNLSRRLAAIQKGSTVFGAAHLHEVLFDLDRRLATLKSLSGYKKKGGANE